MFLSMCEVLDHLDSTTKSRNFIEGEQVVNSNHLIYTGILKENNEQYELLSYCIQSSNTRGDPHEITTVISKTGKVISSVCSCTAGLSERCKHSAGNNSFLRSSLRNFLASLSLFLLLINRRILSVQGKLHEGTAFCFNRLLPLEPRSK